MRDLDRSPLDWVILALLAVLVVTNIAFLILLWTSGPLIGLAFYLVLLVLTLRRQRDHRLVIVGGLVGLAVHVLEVAMVGWSTYPMLMVLNVVMTAGLALVAWLADRQAWQESRKR